jgi:tRNA threonylcarbamoyladenosine biosynthesis protein TsaE
MKLHLADPAATDALGTALARTRPPRAVVHLVGDLGVGKSSLARALLRALGVEGAIRSPTYTLVERYAVDGGDALHLDLYRIGDPGEIEYLGIDGDATVLWLVEWPERGQGSLPPPDLRVELEVVGEGRNATLTACSPAANVWLDRAAAAFTPSVLHG